MGIKVQVYNLKRYSRVGKTAINSGVFGEEKEVFDEVQLKLNEILRRLTCS